MNVLHKLHGAGSVGSDLTNSGNTVLTLCADMTGHSHRMSLYFNVFLSTCYVRAKCEKQKRQRADKERMADNNQKEEEEDEDAVLDAAVDAVMNMPAPQQNGAEEEEEDVPLPEGEYGDDSAELSAAWDANLKATGPPKLDKDAKSNPSQSPYRSPSDASSSRSSSSSSSSSESASSAAPTPATAAATTTAAGAQPAAAAAGVDGKTMTPERMIEAAVTRILQRKQKDSFWRGWYTTRSFSGNNKPIGAAFAQGLKEAAACDQPGANGYECFSLGVLSLRKSLQVSPQVALAFQQGVAAYKQFKEREGVFMNDFVAGSSAQTL